METIVTLSLHEQYVEVKARFYNRTARSYIEHSICGVKGVELIKEPITVNDLRKRFEMFDQHEVIDVTLPYLIEFYGYFTVKYRIKDENNILTFDVIESRCINPNRGGRSCNNTLNNKQLGLKIFMNLLNAVLVKDVHKLNGITANLYSIGE